MRQTAITKQVDRRLTPNSTLQAATQTHNIKQVHRYYAPNRALTTINTKQLSLNWYTDAMLQIPSRYIDAQHQAVISIGALSQTAISTATSLPLFVKYERLTSAL